MEIQLKVEVDALPADATPAQAMAHKLKIQAGRALYVLLKQTLEPVFGFSTDKKPGARPGLHCGVVGFSGC
ncbi:MAG: hypothetical protein AB1768_20930 [Pseudomonadota bacterium]|jgi:hypothetical protein